MKIKVSDLIVRYLESMGVRHIFGMPGAHILPVYDSLFDSSIKTVLAKHEQGASFMASGLTRATGEISACIATAGPGATNLVTGVANAYADKQPMIVITGETSTRIFGRGGLQESTGEGGSIDQYEIFRSITRYARVIERTDYLLNVLRRVTRELHSDTPGPVLLCIPFNVQNEEVDACLLDELRLIPELSRHAHQGHLICQAADLIEASSRPVIISGYGCIKSKSEHLVTELSESLGIPVTSSLKAKGTIDENHALSLGSLGVTSYSQAYRYIVDHSDLLIILGAAFNERTSYLWNTDLIQGRKILQIDINPDQLEKVFTADIAVQADINGFLQSLITELEQRGAERKSLENLTQCRNNVTRGEAGFDASEFEDKFTLIKRLFDKLAEENQHGLQVFDDNIIFAQNFFRVTNNTYYYPNSGVSSLGHAIPAAIGARFARPIPTVVVIGDGGFQMCCMELMTAVNYDIPITVFMLNNSTMGLIRKNQFQKYNERYINCDFVNPNYKALCDSFGVNYYSIRNDNDIESVFSDLDMESTINLVDVYIDKDNFPNYVTHR